LELADGIAIAEFADARQSAPSPTSSPGRAAPRAEGERLGGASPGDPRLPGRKKDVGGRDKPGHDEEGVVSGHPQEARSAGGATGKQRDSEARSTGGATGRQKDSEARSADRIIFSEKFACPVSGFTIPEIEPRLFSFNNPYGACPVCDGFGSERVIDPNLVVP